jgi:hypothetical protein
MLSGESRHTGIHEEAAFDLEYTLECQPRLAEQGWHGLHPGSEFLGELRVNGRESPLLDAGSIGSCTRADLWFAVRHLKYGNLWHTNRLLLTIILYTERLCIADLISSSYSKGYATPGRGQLACMLLQRGIRSVYC